MKLHVTARSLKGPHGPACCRGGASDPAATRALTTAAVARSVRFMSSDPRPEPTVVVRGLHNAVVDPEYAQVMVTLSAAGADRARVLAQLTRRVDEIRQLIGSYGDAVERIDGHPLRGGPQFKNKKPSEKTTGYSASAELGVVIVDFTVLGDLVLRLADADMVALAGPYWALRPGSSAYTRARSEAVRNARLRAEEYAAAAGAKLTGLVEIADFGLSRRDGTLETATPAAQMVPHVPRLVCSRRGRDKPDASSPRSLSDGGSPLHDDPTRLLLTITAPLRSEDALLSKRADMLVGAEPPTRPPRGPDLREGRNSKPNPRTPRAGVPLSGLALEHRMQETHRTPTGAGWVARRRISQAVHQLG